jgi:hypothetical protein
MPFYPPINKNVLLKLTSNTYDAVRAVFELFEYDELIAVLADGVVRAYEALIASNAQDEVIGYVLPVTRDVPLPPGAYDALTA